MSQTSDKPYLQAKIVMSGVIRCLTGLHIGGAEAGVDVGGIDKFVIRNPLNDQPYIPGSSIKGKVRSLIEYAVGTEKQLREASDGRVGQMPDIKEVRNLFGMAIEDTTKESTTDKINTSKASKVIFRDATMIAPYKENEDGAPSEPTALPPTARFKNGLKYTERKAENVLKRITGGATPRQIERVPADSQFRFSLVLNKDVDSEQGDNQNLQLLKLGFDLLARDGLGGMVSRGYGQIEITWDTIEVHKVSQKPLELKMLVQLKPDKDKGIKIGFDDLITFMDKTYE